MALPNLVSRNGEFVANIQLSSRPPPDSLVTNSLLDLTTPQQEGGRSSPHRLSATILEQDEADIADLSDLYRTISRKKILSKVQCSNFNLHPSHEEEGGEEGGGGGGHANCRKHSNIFNHPREGPMTTGQTLARLTCPVHKVENTYVSLTNDSLYTSINRAGDKDKDDNNNKNDEDTDKAAVCRVLLAALAAGQEEAVRHAELANCRDCGEYSGHLGQVIPRLQPCLAERDHYPGLGSADIERGLLESAARHRGLDRGGERRIVCYLAAVVLAILVLVGVIVVLTMMVANNNKDHHGHQVDTGDI